MKSKTTKITIFIVVVVIAMVGIYAYLSSKEKDRKAEAELSEVWMVVSRDLENNYPPSPKEVMKYYNEIQECFYNEECTDEEIVALGNKARELYDAELLEQNDEETYFDNLRKEIEDYKENSRTISVSSVASSTNVDYFTEDGYSFARIQCSYIVLEGGISKPVKQVYLLRKDEEKRWKIYGWNLAENLSENMTQSQGE